MRRRRKEEEREGEKKGEYESTKAARKVNARTRARRIRVEEKGTKRLPDVPPEEKRGGSIDPECRRPPAQNALFYSFALLHCRPTPASLALLPLLVCLSPLSTTSARPSRSTPILFPPLPSLTRSPLNPLILSWSFFLFFCYFCFVFSFFSFSFFFLMSRLFSRRLDIRCILVFHIFLQL